MPEAVPEPVMAPPRSAFVTVVGWMGILIFGFGSMVGVLQNIMVRTMFRDPQVGAMLADSVTTAPIPPEAKFMFGHFESLVSLVLLCSLLGLATSVGLLKRWNWARLTAITLLGLNIAWTLYFLILEQHMFSWMSEPPFPQTAPPPEFAAMFRIMRIFMIVFSLGMTGLCAWLITRLASKRIRAEFVPGVA